MLCLRNYDKREYQITNSNHKGRWIRQSYTVDVVLRWASIVHVAKKIFSLEKWKKSKRRQSDVNANKSMSVILMKSVDLRSSRRQKKTNGAKWKSEMHAISRGKNITSSENRHNCSESECTSPSTSKLFCCTQSADDEARLVARVPSKACNFHCRTNLSLVDSSTLRIDRQTDAAPFVSIIIILSCKFRSAELNRPNDVRPIGWRRFNFANKHWTPWRPCGHKRKLNAPVSKILHMT